MDFYFILKSDLRRIRIATANIAFKALTIQLNPNLHCLVTTKDSISLVLGYDRTEYGTPKLLARFYRPGAKNGKITYKTYNLA